MIKVAIIDYQMGNLHSIYRKLVQLGLRPEIATDAQTVLNADKLILPGVGHFGKAMQNLQNLNFTDALNEAVQIRKKPILGICLGMQLMGRHSEEGDTKGLGWLDAEVVKFKIQDKLMYKVPQTGWNTINACGKNNLLHGLDEQSEFYFLHAYHFNFAQEQEPSVLAKTRFEYDFPSVIAKDHIFGTQFHPEKSHAAGMQLLQNFIQF